VKPLQSWHEPPPRPQLRLVSPGSQPPPKQHPAQFEGPQRWQTPLMQFSSTAQRAHVAPVFPQATLESPPVQRVPEQHPAHGPQVLAWQAPLTQPPGHDAQAPPPRPHAVGEVPATHWPF
jgi:hypothetical protein